MFVPQHFIVHCLCYICVDENIKRHKFGVEKKSCGQEMFKILFGKFYTPIFCTYKPFIWLPMICLKKNSLMTY